MVARAPGWQCSVPLSSLAGRLQDIDDTEAPVQRLGLTEPQQVIDLLRLYPFTISHSS